ncbi:ABC transporter permease [Streptococcus himalayensis]|uniref:ABC transporter permease n=1 Tax=Streptococcus himalayensis TaxID=1888195 RepID=A0A917EER2_9STRE|nr:ABC transporter permease [Streptococcus himalayensis]GGE31306.1 ABC transporter permease [Streptococcus himalayensis]
MAKKTYHKDLRQAITSSLGRFLSIFSLMMIGSMTLVGLKTTPLNMQQSAQAYLNQYRTMDLAVIASYGFSQEDMEELSDVKGSEVEYGHLADVTVGKTDKAFRLFSKPKNISQFQLMKGKLPEKSGEIALLSPLQGDYQLGDTISFSQKKDQKLLRSETFRVTGFVHSSEIWDTHHLGMSSVGAGDLTGYGVILAEDFEHETPTIARLRRKDLQGEAYDSEKSEKNIKEAKNTLTKLLECKGERRLAAIKQAAQKELDQGKKALETAKIDLKKGEQELQEQETQLRAIGVTLDSPQAKPLTAAKEKFEARRKEASHKLAAEEKRLSKAQAEIDSLKQPTYQVYTRSSLAGGNGYMIFNNAKTSIRAVGNLFPLVLYLVAALVTFTTMTRFVDEERSHAGIFKALGYSNRQIIAKFVVYGLTASFTGTVVGVFLGNFYLSPVIDRIVTERTVLGPSAVHFYPSYLLLSLGFSLLSAVFPAYLVARRDVVEEPARLLQAKPPVAGSNIWLEKWAWLWSRLSFHQKVTARNIFRYKQRMLMTIIGVAGSVALLFAGLGIRSSISEVADLQFGKLLTYDVIAVAKSSDEQIENWPSDIRATLPIRYETTQQEITGVKEEQTLSWVVTRDVEKLADFVTLRASNQKPLTLSDDGVIISTRLAQLYQVDVGDWLPLTYQGKPLKLKIAGITELYTGHFLYMTADYFEALTGETYQSNAYFVTLANQTEAAIQQVSSELLKLDKVAAVVQNTSLVSQLRTIVSSLTAVMMILIILSILLGLVILYNLTTINVAERIRELSTIKVLGFYHQEVTLYIYRETIVLSILGMLVGLLGGRVLHQVLLSMISSNTTLFPTTVSWEVYVLPLLVISSILLMLGLLVNRRLKRLDMLEALKSVD